MSSCNFKVIHLFCFPVFLSWTMDSCSLHDDGNDRTNVGWCTLFFPHKCYQLECTAWFIPIYPSSQCFFLFSTEDTSWIKIFEQAMCAVWFLWQPRCMALPVSCWTLLFILSELVQSAMIAVHTLHVDQPHITTALYWPVILFQLIFTVDDGLANVPRNEIHTFWWNTNIDFLSVH